MNLRMCAVALSLVFAQVGKAQESETPDVKQARELITRYLTAVQAKKWDEVRKLIHPETHKAIAERKKRLGKEDHPLAPWFHEKNAYYLKSFKVTSVQAAILGTVVVETSEDNFMVEEKGIAPGEMASYLIGKKGGKWYVVDKKRQETFTNDSIKYGYKNYFDPLPKTETPAE